MEIIKINNILILIYLQKYNMNPSTTNEVDLAQQTTQTSISNLTPTIKYDTSPKIQDHPQIFFQTIKKNHTNSKKKNIFFSTTNHKNENSQDQIQKQPSTDITQDIIKLPKFKENYLDLLINSLNTQINNGSITMEYLNTPSPLKMNDFYYSSTLDDESDSFAKKCENKICAVVVDNPNKGFYAKFTSSFSYKPQSLFLCRDCFEAFRLGNYCYFCNVIYRDFAFNQQYYDRKKWILCEYCQKWQHMQCEEKKGKYKNIEELAMNANFKYMCPFSRKENKVCTKAHCHSVLQKKTKRSPD